ncbi:MAG: rod shape-determining protein RodA [Candidatus Omnitrophica bacterium]|nr:rod shape-determining protein RodA [Candidatus Omnitrophota bacterium]MDD5654267.1 rod shape-determining protein RodA [Candidatus Omnitrophota bacterium]
MRSQHIKIFAIAFLINIIGIFTIYSITSQSGDPVLSVLFKKQMIWSLFGITAFFIMASLSYRRIWDAAYILYATALFLLLLVALTGIIKLGAQRWIKILWLNFQPSELAKLAIVILLAKYFSYRSVRDTGSSLRSFGLARGLLLPLVLVLIPMGLIIEQPDLGTAMMLFFIFICMVYLSGVKLRYLLLLGGVILAASPVFWHFLRDYQKDRLLVFLNPNIDPLGAGYTVIQSKIAIGSGFLLGKGWLFGTQSQLRFLPESHTDFIFATFAEEWGWLGCAVLLSLYYLLIKYALDIASKTSDHFGKLLSLGISVMFGVQLVVNICMTMGLAPVVGIPLILMSYGGSSILITYIALGILANVNKERTVF